MIQKNVIVTSKDALIGSVLVDIVEKEHIGSISSYCTDGIETLRSIERCCPQLLILDLYLPRMNGLSLLKEIAKHHSCLYTLAYCRNLNRMLAVKAVKQGVTGLADYSYSRDLFRLTLERVSRGVKSYPDEVNALLDERGYEIFPQKFTKITTRQSQILEHLALGKSNQEISYELNIHVKTVDKHKSAIKEKFGLVTSAELVHFALRHGIIEKEEGLCM
ncbi:response regulator transcription factor [Oceanispirochaeta sp.]|uniref:response regulator transcription factor n=1 Tax=Oceanispirochaeta sp. TaxID=2035350 RepID=UPI00260E5F04|nr:response regulator transcription factor [Oceanispirochaeta sp.]MDA3957459.1 response regulator transcription factor [Oceanispirochaeta sp.]